MSRALTATIESVTGTPREGLQVDAVNGAAVSAITDAGGVFTMSLEPGAYVLPLMAACIVDGIAYRAGTLLRLTVPDGDGPVTLAACIAEVVDVSLPALLDALDYLTARMAALEETP